MRSSELSPWAARRGCGMKYGAPQRAGWYLDRGGRVSWEAPLAEPAERAGTRPERARSASLTQTKALGWGRKHGATTPAGRALRQATMPERKARCCPERSRLG